MKTAEEWNDARWGLIENGMTLIQLYKAIQSDARKDLEQERDTLQRSNAELEKVARYWVEQHGIEAEKRGGAEHQLDLARKDLAGAFENLERHNAELSAQVERLNEALRFIRSHLQGSEFDGDRPNCLTVIATQAINLTPSDALKPWVEFVESTQAKMMQIHEHMTQCNSTPDSPVLYNQTPIRESLDQARQLLASIGK